MDKKMKERIRKTLAVCVYRGRVRPDEATNIFGGFDWYNKKESRALDVLFYILKKENLLTE